MVDTFVNNGFQKAGFEYLVVDDCWQSRTRDAQGHLQPDKDRFPSGIKSLGDYVSVLQWHRVLFNYSRLHFLNVIYWNNSLCENDCLMKTH